MKTSDIAALLRLIMYDIIGLEIPGLVFLFILLEYSRIMHAFPGLTSRVNTDNSPHIIGTIVLAYVLGYLLQAISYYHFRLLDPLGKRLLGKDAAAKESQDYGVSAAGRFTSSYFEGTEFFKAARKKLGTAAGFEHPDTLTFSDVQNLAFSFGGEEADKARHFRFRSDLCGAMSTLALIHVLMIVPLWRATSAGVPYRWWSIPIGTVVTLVLLRKWCAGELKRVQQHLRWLIPIVIVIWVVVLSCASSHLPSWWVLPILVLVWFFFVYRQFFYGDIGGRVVFYIAVAEISKPHVAGIAGTGHKKEDE